MNPALWRTRMTQLAWTATAVVAMRGVSGTVNTMFSLVWLRAEHRIGRNRGKPFVVLILPLLREQRILTDAVGYLSGLAKQHGKTVVAGVVRQARQWFWSYTEYPLFARLAATRDVGDQRTRAC
ncbi:MAG: hypothetical protein ACRDTA_03395 [Pseudonocardiaceae bacterium]